eukprot:GFUD01039950.1.p1 GENE.GFUD01039950.1~~GFUD01039950.1.p1  ORF type:complete len:796 (+),score=194.27 GFUD01039950.1:2045-4432(+)
MAYFVNTPPLERIRQLFNPEAASGSIGEKVYSLPIYLRRDGVVVKLGYLVRKNECEVLYTVREILVREDLASVTVALSPVECGEEGTAKMREELVLTGVEDISPVKGRLMALDLARDGMRKVARNIATYPIHVQRVVRKHQLAILIRTSVQRFLAGFSMARSISLGCVDWRLDPGLLGLERETDFSLEYRVERFTGGIVSHLDLLLGKEWDVRKIGGGGGFRVIMTLELTVDINQQIRLDTHATLCPGILDKNYRTRCMETFASSITPGQSFVLFSKDNTLEQRFGKPDYTSEKFESLQSQREGVSLDWEEFRDSLDETTLEVSNTNSENDIKGGFGVDANTPFDTTDCDMVEGSDVKEIESESATAIHKLLDTPTKGFSQLVFNVSNKPSGASTDDTIENVSDDVINEIVSTIREVRLSEDSLENSFDAEKDDSQDSQNNNEDLSPIKMIFQNNRSLKYDEYSLNTSDELLSPSKLEHVSDDEYRRSRPTTSTPEGDLAETLPDGIIIVDDNCQESTISTDHLNSKNENFSQETCIANIENQDENQASVSSIRKADDTFENISDLTDDKYSYSNDDHSNNQIENSPHITSPTSSSEPPSTKDGQLTSPDEDVFSEDYRISSSSDMKKDSFKESPENDCATIISTSKDTPVDNSFLQSNDYNVDSLTAPESMVSTPQSSVNKVAAYVQSLPSPESSLSHLDRSEVIHEETEDASNLALDDSFVEDDANHSMASSRSKTSRQSDLSSLNGRFSNGMFYGSAIGASGTGAGQPTCPFPDDWQFNTIPESIENDEDID